MISLPTTPQSKAKNFLSQEDKQLCQSWVAISEDPISGNDQPGEDFWKKVLDHFNQHLPDGGSERQPDGLSLCFGKISRNVVKFVGKIAIVNNLNESGKMDEDKIKDAALLFQTEIKSEFKDLSCYHVLSACPSGELCMLVEVQSGQRVNTLMKSTALLLSQQRKIPVQLAIRKQS
jgi:hypothetical protein